MKQEAQSVTKRRELAETILRILLAGAVVTTVVVMPGLALLIKPIVESYRDYQRAETEKIQRALRRLKERGMIKYNYQLEQWELTDKGQRRARTYELRDLVLPTPPKQWDGQWRLVIFDVPEQAQSLRNLFRRKLIQLGFSYLQRSVWVYPYPCQKELTELAHRLGLTSDVVVAEVSRLTPDEHLLRRYQLTRPA